MNSLEPPLSPSPTASRKRGALRYAAIRKAGLAALGARSASIVTSLLSIPFVERYLGDERFGLYLTLISLIALLSLTDFGVGAALKTRIAQATGRDEISEVKALVSNAFFFLAFVSLVSITIAALLQLTVPWNVLFNVADPQAINEAGPAACVLVICYALSLPLNIAKHTQEAIQKGHLASIWEATGSLATLVALFVAIKMEANLPILIFAFVGAPLLTRLLNTIWFFKCNQAELAPSYGCIDGKTMRTLVNSGGLFVVLQIAGAGAFMSDNIVVAQMIGPSAVQHLAIPAQLFSLISMLMTVFLAPLWPAYGEAATRGDKAWVTRTLKTSIFSAGFVALTCGTCLAVLSPWVLTLWVGDAVNVSATMLAGLVVWKALEAIGVAFSMYLNAMLVIRMQVILATLLLIITVPTKIIVAAYFGVSAIPWATSVCYAMVALIPTSLWVYLNARV